MSLFTEPPAEPIVGKAMKTPEGITHRVTRGDEVLGFVQTFNEGWRGLKWGVLSPVVETQEEAVAWLTSRPATE